MYPGAYDPARPAVVTADGGRTLTYGQLEERSLRLADHLRSRGLRSGDHVAILSDNDPRVLEVYWAALRSGLYLTAVNHHLTADEAAYIVRDCGARVLIVSGTLGELADSVAQLLPGAALRLDDGSYEAALAAASPEPPAHQPRGADMLYSSGTTGRPKGIEPALPEGDVREVPSTFQLLFQPLYGFDEHTVYLCPAPLYHAAPLRFCYVVTATGGTVVLMDHFDAETALAAVEQHRITHSEGVPPARTELRVGEGAHRVRTDAQTAVRDAAVVRRLVAEGRHPRGSALPGRGQAADDGVVGAGPVRVLRGDRGQRDHLHRPRGVVAQAGVGGPGRAPR